MKRTSFRSIPGPRPVLQRVHQARRRSWRARSFGNGPVATLIAGSIALLAGCSPEVDTGIPTGVEFQEISGEWSYAASQITDASNPGVVCEVSGITLSISKIPRAGAFSGRTSAGRLTCTDRFASFIVPLESFPIMRGYTFNEFISFDVYTPDWRHDGLVTTDSMSGRFTLRSGVHRFTGNFVARRRRAQ